VFFTNFRIRIRIDVGVRINIRIRINIKIRINIRIRINQVEFNIRITKTNKFIE
jgi:hypothetical protein